MSAGLDRTFEFLARSTNPASLDPIRFALDVPDIRISTRAVVALVSRRDPSAAIELVRRWPDLSVEMRQVLNQNIALFSATLRHCLLHGNEALRTNALHMLHWLEDYSQVPTLLNLLEAVEADTRLLVERALRGLTDRLHEHLRFGKEPDGPSRNATFLRDAPRIRHQVLEALDHSARRYDVHQTPLVLESLLALCHPDDPQVKRLFKDPASSVAQSAETVLATSSHPGVLSLIVDSMAGNFPVAPLSRAFARRTDPEFLCHVLRSWPKKLTTNQQRQFREIRKLGWIEQRPLDLEILPPGLHRPLVGFVMATGAPHDDKLEVLEWIVRNGSPEGRQAATDVLAEVQDDRIHDVIREGLDSDAPDVQAWATTQLRPREVPGAIEMLLERIDSPLPDVREAARSELRDFNLFRVLELYESLDPARAIAVGRLVKKIDGETISKLKAEMVHPIQRRRVRAVQCAQRVGWLADIVPELVLRLDDEDAVVRRSVVEALSGFPNVAARELPRMLRDSSSRVREAASLILEQIGQMELAGTS